MRSLVCSLLLFSSLLAGADLDECRELALADPDAAGPCYRALLAGGAAVRAEAAWALGDIPAANAAFRAAVEEAPEDPQVRVRWAELYAGVGQQADAEALFGEALALDAEHAGARLGLARLALGRFDARAGELAEAVLDAQPESAPARLILARLALESGDLSGADRLLAGPLAAVSVAHRLEAMALAAARDHLAGTVPSAWEGEALALAPQYGALFETVAHFYVITRRYREAVAALERAVALDPTLWSAHGALGINLLRVNRFADARRALARAHNGAPYDAAVVNTLRLLDSLESWERFADGGLVLRIAPEESGALAGYSRRLVEDAVRVIGDRYGYRPSEPVVVELYPYHEDFAVRTSGLPGIGILGATFGEVVVMDGPSVRGVDEGFDWASVLWHELAHVITLGATRNRVSRWFSEGVSVFEEWQTGPARFALETGRPAVPLDVVEAHREERLLPIATLDEGFIRPRYRGQIAVSYVQAGLVCEFLAEAHGADSLVRMLAAYRDGLDTAAAVRRALDSPPEDVDEAFAAYLDARFAAVAPDAYRDAWRQAREAAEGEDWAAAAEAAERAIAANSHAVEGGGPYVLLAEARHRLGDREAALAALLTYWRAGGRRTAPMERLAKWLDEAGRADESLAVRRAWTLADPLPAERRAELGDRLLAAGLAAEALTEYLAYESRRPHDRADVHFRIAKAHGAMGARDAALRRVLQALEVAPQFPEALELLVELTGPQ